MPQETRRLAYRFLAVAALLIFFALALDTAGRKAVTTDEPLHLTHSIAMLQTGLMSIPEMHTPLTYQLIGRLLATEPPLPDVTALDSWPTLNPFVISRELIWRDDVATDRIVWLGRFVVAGMGVLLGALMAAWTWTLSRGHLPTVAGLLSLYALAPNLLASAALVTTDIAATLTWFLCIYTWWRYWQRPGWGRWLMAGVALGLALAAKLTGVLLLPITLILALLYQVRVGRWWHNLGIWAGMLPVAALILWALYNFDMRGVLPMPAYLEAWQLLLLEVDVSHANFFMGRVSPVGSWLYLPATLLLKNPLLQLALFLLIPLVLWWERRRWRTLIFLLLPAVFFLLVSAASRVNYGYRHALPAVPFLMVLGVLAIPRLWIRPIARVALVAGLGLTALSALAYHPDHLTYFNELVGGRGYHYLGDSNLDWGQDLNQLAAYAARYRSETGRPLHFSYTGVVDREHYGLAGLSLTEQFNRNESAFAPANPPAGRYAINTGDLQGTGLILGELRESDLFDWFRRQQPMETLGGSIFIYDVPRQADGTWMAHCAPDRLLNNEQAERLIGRGTLRHVEFDCRTNWVFPGGGPGWYVLPPEGTEWLGRRLGPDSPREVYRHRANAYGPDYVIVYWPGTPEAALGDNLQPFAGEGGGPATLRGFGAAGAEWVTFWEVIAATTEPLSVKAHLLAGDSPPQVADGLGFAANQWQPGDWFIQRHVFPAPGTTLETGLYNYVTLQAVSGPIRLVED
ncbi:ArnT family glycosyltransferase [Candidatus Promineifilum breve]|nr:glycosyltransferase family 39 protein [Candidatus Promineifilum breve]